MTWLDRLREFPCLVVTVGCGCPPNDRGVNDLSGRNAERAAEIALAVGGLLFIAGGNGGEYGRRGDKRVGSLQEAPRMQRYIEARFGTRVPIVTDTEPAFDERYGFAGSMNTIENARNAVCLIADGGYSVIDLAATRQHLPRCIGTLRTQMARRGLQQSVSLAAHPVDAIFERTNDQPHLTSAALFAVWSVASTVQHYFTAQIPLDHAARVFFGGYADMYELGRRRFSKSPTIGLSPPLAT